MTTDRITIAAGEYTPENALKIIEAGFGGRDKLIAALDLTERYKGHIAYVYHASERLPNDLAGVSVICQVLDGYGAPTMKRILDMVNARYAP